MDFEHNSCRYNIVPNHDGTRLRLWFDQRTGHGWEFGHAKNVPVGMPLHVAAKHMQEFATGKLAHHEYNELLPSA